ncbi:periplasmic heavy metal sensor [Microvirga sp. BT689]|uniref:Spy/CpxP family protein refolding chaperone n=1 Tax=Microvirga arvi TaxID=2778731 RepID=UPI0019526E50|nr:periplasmic heavy metal sensor [Microvirga arvi]MBM6583209.1 periplasmic heavy metal sensor [Microvirga arvi]
MLRLGIALAATLLAPRAAHAQHASASPYAGMEHRAVKALSDQQIADLRAGRGMGLALPAELNGYPGPIHVLELADRLGLSGEQRARVQELHAAMKAETVPLGERLIAQETALDRQFATKSVTPASLQAATADIGATQGTLRGAHLHYHLSTLEVLTPEQVHRYGELRGYQASGGHGHGAKRHH